MQIKTSEKIFFDEYAKIDEYDVFTEKGWNRLTEEFKMLVNPRKGQKLLDMGCGTGGFIKRLDKNLNLFGVDISTVSIVKAKCNNSDINFIIGDIENTNFKENTFDIVVFSGVLHHFQNFKKSLDEAHIILKPGGKIFAFDPHKKNPIMWLYRDKKSPFSSVKGRTENEKLIEKNEITLNMENAGFKNIKAYPISGISYKFVETRFAKLFLPLYNKTDKLFDIIKFLKPYGSFIISYGEKSL